jgi:hypothetical protein
MEHVHVVFDPDGKFHPRHGDNYLSWKNGQFPLTRITLWHIANDIEYAIEKSPWPSGEHLALLCEMWNRCVKKSCSDLETARRMYRLGYMLGIHQERKRRAKGGAQK